jgi:hypothetical protein
MTAMEDMAMNPITLLIVGYVLLGTFIGVSTGDDQYQNYLVEKDGKPHLKHRLVIREEQLGFAGVSGRMWDIEPDGQWKLVDLQPAGSGKVQETTRQNGRLTAKQLVTLAKELASQDLAGLPNKIGEAPRANPHRIVMKFGEKQMVLNGIVPRRSRETTMRELITKSAPKQEALGSPQWARWAAVAHAVESHASAPKP